MCPSSVDSCGPSRRKVVETLNSGDHNIVFRPQLFRWFEEEDSIDTFPFLDVTSEFNGGIVGRRLVFSLKFLSDSFSKIPCLPQEEMLCTQHVPRFIQRELTSHALTHIYIPASDVNP